MLKVVSEPLSAAMPMDVDSAVALASALDSAPGPSCEKLTATAPALAMESATIEPEWSIVSLPPPVLMPVLFAVALALASEEAVPPTCTRTSPAPAPLVAMLCRLIAPLFVTMSLLLLVRLSWPNEMAMPSPSIEVEKTEIFS